ncbi:MAG: type II toxin-antitoxin system VapC family toxin [Anaerolineales bacterium]|nr:MAG: type II toxin-antitoxin system VapC family toxin [Anaerolineales bacterium]
MNYILDTNVISELVATEPDAEVITWIDSIDPESVFLSVITIGELKKGIEKLPSSKRKQDLTTWLQEDLLVRFHDRILSLDIPVLLSWGVLIADLEKKGKPLPAIDSLLAATAAETGFTLATRNVAHFKSSGIAVINPWAGAPE